jgi:hypothetical protein
MVECHHAAIGPTYVSVSHVQQEASRAQYIMVDATMPQLDLHTSQSLTFNKKLPAHNTSPLSELLQLIETR